MAARPWHCSLCTPPTGDHTALPTRRHALTHVRRPDDRARTPLPEHAQREFEDCLKCGCLEHGFLRVRHLRRLFLVRVLPRRVPSRVQLQAPELRRSLRQQIHRSI